MPCQPKIVKLLPLSPYCVAYRLAYALPDGASKSPAPQLCSKWEMLNSSTRNSWGRIPSLCSLLLHLTLLSLATACRKMHPSWSTWRLSIAPSALARYQSESLNFILTHSERDHLENSSLLARTAQSIWGFKLLLFVTFRPLSHAIYALPVSQCELWYHVKIPRCHI